MINFEDNDIDNSLKSCQHAFLYIIFFGLVASFLTLATSIYSLEVFDRVLSSGSIPTLLALTLIIVIFFAVLNFIQIIRSLIVNDINNFLDQKLSPIFINKAFIALKTNSSSTLASYYIKDLANIKSFIASNNFIVAIDAPWSLIYIMVIFLIHPLLGVIVVIGALLLMMIALINNTLTKKITSKISDTNLLVIRDLEIMERNIETIEAMQMKESLINNWQENSEKLKKLQNRLMLKSSIIAGFSRLLRNLIYIVTIAGGAMLVIENKMSSGGIIACSILSGKALMPFDTAISLWNSFLTSQKSYLRLKKLAAENIILTQKISLPNMKGDVAIEKLIFTHPQSSKPILNNINIAAGEIIAIVGPSASGKSTLAKLIAGVYNPNFGTVRLDGADIRNCNHQDLGQHIGYLPQGIELFSGSVKTNIARMQKVFDDQSVLQAAQKAFAHQMILQLSKGYETDIGVWGAKISAGQKQRIALARAFYGHPKLVILDEPNSNLDSEGDIALSNCLSEARKQKITTIIISHRQHILQNVDKILVLVKGEVRAFGTQSEIAIKIKNSE